MTAWHYYDHETPEDRHARLLREAEETTAADELTERRFGIRHSDNFWKADESDLMNGDAERDAGKQPRFARPALRRDMNHESGRGSDWKRRTA